MIPCVPNSEDRKEEVSLSDKMAYLEQYALTHPSFSFRSILESQSSKMEVDRDVPCCAGVDEDK